MLGAPEVLQFGKNFIRLIHAKRCLDVGTFTGASALAWALALPVDGEVASFDVDHTALNAVGTPIFDKHTEIKQKIKFHLGPAIDALDKLIFDGESGKWDFAFIDADKQNYPKYYEKCMTLLRSGGVIFIDNLIYDGESGKWDFAFIDADKQNYPKYYEKCMTLLRSGGVIFIDNALWSGKVATDPDNLTEMGKAIDATNKLIAADVQADNMLLNLGDGCHVVFKK
uniref:O-methyltransferase n=1 Tax=Panagrolaimus sp. PS1159 TaxID=55785 RepID=A0AC35GAR6_9BILA